MSDEKIDLRGLRAAAERAHESNTRPGGDLDQFRWVLLAPKKAMLIVDALRAALDVFDREPMVREKRDADSWIALEDALAPFTDSAEDAR